MGRNHDSDSAQWWLVIQQTGCPHFNTIALVRVRSTRAGHPPQIISTQTGVPIG